MKAALKFILSYWGLWPLLTAVFSLVLGVGITNNWGNAALWLWFCLIIVTLITQLYVMLQYVKARKWMSAFMLLQHFQLSANYNVACGKTAEMTASQAVESGLDALAGKSTDARANAWQVGLTYYF